MDYLPEGYEDLHIAKNYISLPKLPEGEHRFRIVQRPIAGWVDWKERKPYRYRPNNRPEESFNPQEPMRPFWACYVWDYARNGLFVMEITQSSILKALTQFGRDEEWGDFTNYDVKIIKEGSGKETKYHVSPVPHKPLRDDIKEALKQSPVQLEALYEGGDPWEGIKKSIAPTQAGITQAEADYLDDLIGNDQGLRSNILNFLKEKGHGNTLLAMPSAMYEKMVARAMQSKNERVAEEKRRQDDFKSTKTIDINSFLKPQEEEALPF